MRTDLVIAALLGVLPPFASAQLSGSPNHWDQEGLNVLLILADQWNPRCMGTASSGFGGLTQPLTPRLDQLADEGVLFERGYTQCPQCKPARATLFTGLEQREHGVRWNDVWDPPWMETIAHRLRAAGYHTATIGKHHMPWLDQPEGYGVDHGFDLVVDLGDYHQAMSAAGKPHWYANGNHQAVPGLPPKLSYTGVTFSHELDHPIGYWEQRSRAFLEERSADREPFFLVHSLYGPHTPILPSGHPDSDWAHLHAPFQNLDLPPSFSAVAGSPRGLATQAEFQSMTPAQHREVLSLYYGLISQIDASLGRLLDSLESLGLAEDTLVMFVADHGELATEFASWTKGGPSLEALVRVPFLMRNPRSSLSGIQRSELVSHLDVVPTILEATGVPAADSWWSTRQGASLLPLSESMAAPTPWRDHLVIDFGSTKHARMRAVVQANSKLILDDFGGSRLLHDLTADPFEITNLAGEPWMQPVEDALQAQFDAWHARGLLAPEWRGTASEQAHAPPAPVAPLAPSDASLVPPGAVRLEWVPSTSATVQHVFLALEDEPAQRLVTLPASAGEWVLGCLPGSREFVWRVDTVNVHGSTRGPDRTFVSQPSGHLSPGMASKPRPSRRSVMDAGPIPLRWTPAPHAAFQRVWFRLGEQPWSLVRDFLPPDVAEVPCPTVAPGTLHSWRVDAAMGSNWTLGEEWSFEVSDRLLPGPVTELTPHHLQVVRPGDLPVRARPVAGALEYRLHAGTNQPLPLHQSGPTPEFLLPALQGGSRWAIRIDVVSAAGVRRGRTHIVRVRG